MATPRSASSAASATPETADASRVIPTDPTHYDVCIIGSGPGGFAAAMRGFDLGKKVCLIEGGHIGGAGIMHGAMTSKTMWELAKDYANASSVDRGYRAAGLMVDYQAVRDTIIQAARMPALSSGAEMSTMVRPQDAPDIRAASSISDDNCLTLLRMNMKAKGKRCAVKAMKNSQSVP